MWSWTDCWEKTRDEVKGHKNVTMFAEIIIMASWYRGTTEPHDGWMQCKGERVRLQFDMGMNMHGKTLK